MKHTRTRVLRATLVFVVVVASVALLGPTALAADDAAVGTLTPSSVGAGTTGSYTFVLSATGSATVGSFSLSAPSGWTISSVDSWDQEGASVALAPDSDTEIQGTGVDVSSGSSLTVTFTATAPCGTTDPTDWTLSANSGPDFDGDPVTTDETSSLGTPLNGTCTAEFTEGRGPTDSAFVSGSPVNISSVAYTPGADAIQVLVSDAAEQPRSDIAISLNLSTNPTSATLSAPANVVSDGDGFAEFSPVKINKTGLKYKITPQGGTDVLGVVGTESGAFDVYQEQTNCSGSCSAHGNSTTIHSTVTANSQTGSLAVLVSGVVADVINCAPTVPTGYNYKPVSSEVTSWQFTGAGTQIVTVVVDKSLVKKVFPNRGSAHIDFCYQPDGAKTFVDKFGVTRTSAGPGLLSDCTKKITHNCILSETAIGAGDRIIKVTVDDGKGRP
jgi:hypothetical protein